MGFTEKIVVGKFSVKVMLSGKVIPDCTWVLRKVPLSHASGSVKLLLNWTEVGFHQSMKAIDCQEKNFIVRHCKYKAHWLILEVRNIKITSNLCSTLSTKLVFDSIKKSLSEIKISYFCDNEIRVQVLNTAQFAEVYFIIQNFKNLATLAFCTLLQCFTKKGCQKNTDVDP